LSGYLVVGRSRECDIVLVDPTVSSRHVRIERTVEGLDLIDLDSANGTFVQGERVRGRIEISPGQDVTLGQAPLNWHDPALRALYAQPEPDVTSPTLVMPGRRYICGHCRAKGLMPAGYLRKTLRCKSCGRMLQLVDRRGRGWVSRVAMSAAAALLVAGTLAGVMMASSGGFWSAAERLGISTSATPPVRSPQEASIRRHTVPRVLAAIDPHHSRTRNAAVQVAAQSDGPYSVEQVARIWQHARSQWDYVNDPHGAEYFASASETIRNGYAGDCDDFAILMTAMVVAVGGEARIVMVEGTEGGHSYAEACIIGDPEETRLRLERHFRTVGHESDDADFSMHYRRSPDCEVWLNLDWNAGAPGGAYDPERWAVGIYSDGRTETLGVVPDRSGEPAAQVEEAVRGHEAVTP
jgi:uncharacterized protein (DUF983 family)